MNNEVPDEHNPDVPALPDYRPGFDKRPSTVLMRGNGVICGTILPELSSPSRTFFAVIIDYETIPPSIIGHSSHASAQISVNNLRYADIYTKCYVLEYTLPPLDHGK